jgi:hypothetical protein
MFTFLIGLLVGVPIGLFVAGLMQAARWGQNGHGMPSYEESQDATLSARS